MSGVTANPATKKILRPLDLPFTDRYSSSVDSITVAVFRRVNGGNSVLLDAVAWGKSSYNFSDNPSRMAEFPPRWVDFGMEPGSDIAKGFVKCDCAESKEEDCYSPLEKPLTPGDWNSCQPSKGILRRTVCHRALRL